ncbi:MAG: hypothetical protein OXH28_12595 [bacterium]|nr:hypothetical protein [bacterium]
MRGGLLLLGLVLVVASGGGFWYVLQTVDERQEYVVTARTIERWEIANPADFAVVEANVGDAGALPAQFLGIMVGRWATGRIPAGTLVTPGMFETPPLSSDEEAGKVLIEVSLPAGEAPLGELKAGDRLALFGAEATGLGLDDPGLGLDDPGLGVAEPAVSLIGILTLDFVEGDSLIYLVTPPEAKAIQDTVDRYSRASERSIWKLGSDVSAEDLVELYGSSANVSPAGER